MTDNDIIEMLDMRRQLLLAEAHKLEQIMGAIRSSGELLRTLAKPVIREKKDGAWNKKPSGKTLVSLSEKRLLPTTDYNETGKLDEKIAYALTLKNGAIKEDIIKVLMEHRPDQDIYKLRNAVGVRLSYLLKRGHIAARKQGRSYKYKLIKQ